MRVMYLTAHFPSGKVCYTDDRQPVNPTYTPVKEIRIWDSGNIDIIHLEGHKEIFGNVPFACAIEEKGGDQ